ncbi:non-specific lipid-transfer protein 1-like [Syzygium oleosum]|uniref:non-specific lipid-transfer protein 1-like n=1 Tax=Syzygium oleosum TaxID=219896 RepID=UPI0011D1915B|nr:non-specific lipid-transfer protein 1-like [Syzygium oleosum]
MHSSRPLSTLLKHIALHHHFTQSPTPNMASLKLVCLALAVGLVVAAPLAESAISCGQVTNSVAPCLGYLRKGGAIPPACCNGIRSLNSAARTTPDRQAACRCMKAASSSIQGINFGLASALPGKCGVNIPYKISPATDCNRVR